MASISLVLLGFFAVLWGVYHFNKKLKGLTGSVVVVVIGLVGLYAAITFSDVLLSYIGLDTGFPTPDKGYYLLQSFLYIGLGMFMLGAYYYLLKDIAGAEISLAFWWDGIVLLLTGGLDLVIEAFIRVEILEIRFLFAILLLAGLVLLAIRYREKFFGKREGIPKEGE